MNEQEFIDVVKSSLSIREVIRKLGKASSDSMYEVIRRKIKKLNLDTSHFSSILNKKLPEKRTVENTLICREKDSNRQHSAILKTFLLQIGREYKCELCDNHGNYNGKELVLDIDHKNRVRTDDRPENLRFLCPNCHRQENMAYVKANKKEKPYFNKYVNKESERKARKDYKKRPIKIPPISKQDLADRIEKETLTEIGKSFNVTANSVKKWAKKYGLELKPRDYWVRENLGKLKINKEELSDLIDKFPIEQIAKKFNVHAESIRSKMKLYGLKGKPPGYWGNNQYQMKVHL